MVKRGWTAGCERYQVDGRYVAVRTDGNVGEMLSNLETIVASGSDGIACVITDQNALEAPLRKATDAGVPVIAVNVKDSRDPPARIPYLVYVGEGSYETGKASAQVALDGFRQLANRPPKHAMYLVHAASIQCLEERGEGMKDVYGGAGTKFTKVACKFDPTTTQEAIRAFVSANPDVEVIHSGASQVAHWAVEVLKQLDRIGNVDQPFSEGKIYVAGIDMDPQLLQDILDGDAIATIDQQPYYQGYLAAMVLAQYKEFQFLPSADVRTGPYTVTRKNAQQRLEQLAAMEH